MRETRLSFIGDELVAGHGDGRALGWTGRVMARTRGVDAITFTAGIGENDSRVRAELCGRLAHMGIRFDAGANAVRAREPLTNSTPESSVIVMVVPTNEELSIARQALTLI